MREQLPEQENRKCLNHPENAVERLQTPSIFPDSMKTI